jgi:hypothetical protein
MYFRTVDEIINAAMTNALEVIKTMPQGVKPKYRYKEKLKSRKNKR